MGGGGGAAVYHDFMKDSSSAVSHLVKLIDAADASITEHQSPTRRGKGEGGGGG